MILRLAALAQTGGRKGHDRLPDHAMSTPHDLDRFLAAQADTYDVALAEIRRGAKRGHWMWFIFPQVAGLGRSPIAQHYAIRSLDEAKAYLAHPVLGSRLCECVAALRGLIDLSPESVFGEVDAMKLRSSLTLFIEAGGGLLFESALQRWFEGEKDQITLRLLAEGKCGDR